MRVKRIIKIEKISDLYSFVRCAEGASRDVICCRDKYIVDGRSLMGVLSLDPTKPFEVEYDEMDNGLTICIDNFEV